jgi:hypothetical protein
MNQGAPKPLQTKENAQAIKNVGKDSLIVAATSHDRGLGSINVNSA